MKKKLILSCLIVVLILGLAVNAHAAGQITVTGIGGSAAAGEGISVPITVSNVAGNVSYGITAVLVKVEWDANVLEYTGYTGNSALSSTQWSGANGGNVFATANSGMKDDFTLITLNFKVKEDAAPGNTTVKLTLREMLDDEEEITNVTCTSAVITVTAPQVHGSWQEAPNACTVPTAAATMQ